MGVEHRLGLRLPHAVSLRAPDEGADQRAVEGEPLGPEPLSLSAGAFPHRLGDPPLARLATRREFSALGANTGDPPEPPRLLRGHAARLAFWRQRPGRRAAMHPAAPVRQRPAPTPGATDNRYPVLSALDRVLDPGVAALAARSA